MSIRLVAMDLDDTLLCNDWTISPASVEAIRKAQQQGVKITIATGRMAISTRPYAEQLGLDLPVITYHGALVKQVLSGEILFRRPISSNLAQEVITFLLENKMYSQIYLNDTVVVQEFNEWSNGYARLAKVQIEKKDLIRTLEAEPVGTEKILAMDEEAVLDNFAPVLREKFGDRLHITKSKPNFLEITDITVNKGVALAGLAERFGIPREEVMAIGDSFNDIEMIKYAGLGVAMGNARPEIRQIADVITGTNEEDGVAQVLNKYVLK